MPIVIGNQTPNKVFVPVLGAIVLLAWISLWLIERSDYGWLLHRHSGAHLHEVMVVPGWAEATLFLAGWLIMTIAMMLPTTVPLILNFQQLVAKRRRSTQLTILLLSGYLVAWFGLGILTLAALSLVQLSLKTAIEISSYMVSAVLFVIAGGFQFSRLKYACLDKCRSPAGFVISHWHGRNAAFESFKIGWSHGLFCVGCCWALMLLMFAVSTANLAWMLTLATLMALEKNMPWGAKMARPLGAALIMTGLLIIISYSVR